MNGVCWYTVDWGQRCEEAWWMKDKYSSVFICRSNKQVGWYSWRALALFFCQLSLDYFNLLQPACWTFFIAIQSVLTFIGWDGRESRVRTHTTHSIIRLHVFLFVCIWMADLAEDAKPLTSTPPPHGSLHPQWWPTKTGFLLKYPALAHLGPCEWQPSQELDTNTQIISMFPCQQESSLKFTSIQTGLGVRSTGRHGCAKKYAPFSSRAVRQKPKGFPQRQTRAVDQPHGLYYCIYTVQTS